MIRISDEKHLGQAAKALLEKHQGKRIFAFFGPMGVGKTTFIKVLCRLLGVEDLVGSPSFSIVNQYADKNGDPVYHFDFYRIRKIDEVFDLGYEDYFFSGYFCLIEWPEKMQQLLPEDCVRVNIEEQDGERIFRF
jgi:tRNA threonylcarbamoyladenosine biosynthesis protein TsaE